MRANVYSSRAADRHDRLTELRPWRGTVMVAVHRLMPWAAAAIMLFVMICVPAAAQATGSGTGTINGIFGGANLDQAVTNGASSFTIWSIRIAAAVAIVGAVILVGALVMGEDRFPRQKAINWFVGTVGLSFMIFIVGQTFNGAGATASGIISGVGGTVPGSTGNGTGG